MRQARIRAGLSQIQLAEVLGVHKSVISLIETEIAGEFPSPEMAERIVVACSEAQNAANGTAA